MKAGRSNRGTCGALNESPSEKEGKCCRETVRPSRAMSLNESPSEKEGKSRSRLRRIPALGFPQ